MTLDVVFEDSRVIALSKPPGQPVIPGRGPAGGPCLRAAVEARLGGKVFVVHRIDAEASGVVLFAKDAEAHRALCLAFEGRRARKTYLAAVQGEMTGQGEVDLPLRDFGSGKVGVDPRGKASRTRWRVLKRLRAGTLLEAEPLTGRRHQLRVHLYALGHPILGDTRYGAARPVGGAPRLMLHALRLRLRGPRGPLDLEAPARDFEKALKSLEG